MATGRLRRLTLLATLLLAWLPARAATAQCESCATPLVTSLEADLDGDGEVEHASLAFARDAEAYDPSFLLNVDGVATAGELSFPPEGFFLVDLDVGDRFLEVAVYTPGPSSDDQYAIFRYDGGALREVGRLQRWPTFHGDGTVTVADWMGFWARHDLWVMEDGALRRVPRSLYHVGVETVLREPLTLRDEPGAEGTHALRAGERVEILLHDDRPVCPGDGYDPCGYYLLQGETAVGWARLDEFAGRVDALPYAD